MIKRHFIYTPTTGSKIFAATLQQPHVLAAFKMPNESIHVFGGFRLEYPESSRKWRDAARKFVKAVARGYGSNLKSIVAWDDKGSINIVVPFEFAYKLHRAMSVLYREVEGKYIDVEDGIDRNLIRLAAEGGDSFCLPQFDDNLNMTFHANITSDFNKERFHIFKPSGIEQRAKNRRAGIKPKYIDGKDLGLKVQNTKMPDGKWIATVYVDHRNYVAGEGLKAWEADDIHPEPETLFITTGKLRWYWDEYKPEGVLVYDQDFESEECTLYETIDAPYHNPMQIKQEAFDWYEAKQEAENTDD